MCKESVAARGGLVPHTLRVPVPQIPSSQCLGDVAVSGLPGWVALYAPFATQPLELRVWVPRGVEVFLRPPVPCPPPPKPSAGKDEEDEGLEADLADIGKALEVSEATQDWQLHRWGWVCGGVWGHALSEGGGAGAGCVGRRACGTQDGEDLPPRLPHASPQIQPAPAPPPPLNGRVAVLQSLANFTELGKSTGLNCRTVATLVVRVQLARKHNHGGGGCAAPCCSEGLPSNYRLCRHKHVYVGML